MNCSQSKIWIWANRLQLTQNENIAATLFTVWMYLKYYERGNPTTFRTLSQCWHCSSDILQGRRPRGEDNDNVNESCHIYYRWKRNEWEDFSWRGLLIDLNIIINISPKHIHNYFFKPKNIRPRWLLTNRTNKLSQFPLLSITLINITFRLQMRVFVPQRLCFFSEEIERR